MPRTTTEEVEQNLTLPGEGRRGLTWFRLTVFLFSGVYLIFGLRVFGAQHLTSALSSPPPGIFLTRNLRCRLRKRGVWEPFFSVLAFLVRVQAIELPWGRYSGSNRLFFYKRWHLWILVYCPRPLHR